MPPENKRIRPGRESGARPFVTDLQTQPLEGSDDEQAGNLTWRTLISADRCPSDEVVIGVAEFPPGGVLKAHRHRPAEFYFVLSGEGTVTVDGLPLRLSKGVAAFIPGNAEHDVVAGQAGLSILYGFATHAFEDVIYRYSADLDAGAIT